MALQRRCRFVPRHLSNDQTAKLRNALFDAFRPKGTDGKPSKQAISDSAVSETWGGQITKKALIALVVFLVLVSLYIMVRYERYMAISALTTMCFDLTVTAGVYSLVGFEVTPATVIGLLTILGFSLYDTVIVFDKVEENTHGFQHTTRRTFAEQANLAINQTFMRSINTSLISVLPVLALMVVAVWLLGVGTLKDLALVQLVGIIVGTYSSIFFATPLLVTLRERTELVRTHTRRVVRRRGPGSRAGADGNTGDAEKESTGDESPKESARRQHRSCRAAGQRRRASRQHRTSRRRVRGRCGPLVPGVRPASGTPAGGSRDGQLVSAKAGRYWLAGRLAGSWLALAGWSRRCAPFALIACSGSAAGQIDYVVDGTLVTYNTNTVVGAASAGAQAFARTLTGFGYHGPDGQVVADRDFGTVSVVGGAPLVLDYQIADNAVYSDGKPVTCDDLVLAWAAQSGRFPGFEAATQAGYVDIANDRMHAGAEEGPRLVRPGPQRRRLHPAVRRDLDDAVARHRRPAECRCDGGVADQQRAVGGPDREAVEHHLGPQARYRPQTLPLVGTVQDPIRVGRRRCGARRQRPVVGRQGDHQAGHRMAPGEPISRTGSTTGASTWSTSRSGRRERWPLRTTISAAIRRRPASSS